MAKKIIIKIILTSFRIASAEKSPLERQALEVGLAPRVVDQEVAPSSHRVGRGNPWIGLREGLDDYFDQVYLGAVEFELGELPAETVFNVAEYVLDALQGGQRRWYLRCIAVRTEC